MCHPNIKGMLPEHHHMEQKEAGLEGLSEK